MAPGKSDTPHQSEQSAGNPTPKRSRSKPPAAVAEKPTRVSNQAEQAARTKAEAVATAESAVTKGEPAICRTAPPPRLEAAVQQHILPAWVASYTNHVAMALLSREPFRETIPITGDDRLKVSDTEDTTAFAWRCLCRLDITSRNGRLYLGTGWLAGPKTVITAGHCVFLKDDGGWATKIKVTPAFNNGDEPFDAIESVDLNTTSTWQSGDPADLDTQVNDYGAIQLPSALSLGFFGYASLSDDDLLHTNVNVYGYPADKNEGAALWGHYRQLYKATSGQLFYDIATVGGESGSPVFIKQGDKWTVVGIHNYGGSPANSATRITDDVFLNIKAWVG